MNSNNKSNQSKDLTLAYTEVDSSKLSFTKLEENDRSKGQKIAYPRYDHPRLGVDKDLIIQLPWIKLTSYGIPRNDEYHPDDSKRGYIKVPLDQSIQEVSEFSKMLQSIDAELGSEKYKQLWFGSQASKYTYTSLFRIPDEDASSKKDKKNQGPKLPYMKIKLDTTYPDNRVKTVVFNSVQKGNKRERTLLDDITDIDSLARHVSFLSTVRLIIRPIKLWATSNPSKTYGLTFKVLKIEVEPSEKSKSQLKEYMNDTNTFLDSDDEESTQPEVNKPVTKQPEVNKSTKQSTKQVAQVDSDSESDVEDLVSKTKPVKIESSDEESDEEVKPTPKKQPAKVESSDEESEEEVKPKSKKPIQVESDDESDDEPKAVKGKKPVTKGKNKK